MQHHRLITDLPGPYSQRSPQSAWEVKFLPCSTHSIFLCCGNNYLAHHCCSYLTSSLRTKRFFPHNFLGRHIYKYVTFWKLWLEFIRHDNYWFTQLKLISILWKVIEYNFLTNYIVYKDILLNSLVCSLMYMNYWKLMSYWEKRVMTYWQHAKAELQL